MMWLQWIHTVCLTYPFDSDFCNGAVKKVAHVSKDKKMPRLKNYKHFENSLFMLCCCSRVSTTELTLHCKRKKRNPG